MLNQKELSALSRGDSVDHFLIVRKLEPRITKTNRQYLAMDLGDKSFTLNANVWENFETVSNSIKSGDVIKVSGTIEEYQGNLQIKISSIRTLNPDENLSSSEFLPKSKKDSACMKNNFLERIENISSPYLKSLMKLIFSGEHMEKFSTAPAGKTWHHSYIHGLIEHTLEVINICDLMCDIHPEINRDLLVCGAMMHDFGKTEELKYKKTFEYSDKGKLIGHIVISAMLINEETKKIAGFPEELKNCLIHIILSHQGKLEYASPVVPKTLEAITLYHADELSAKANAYKNAIATQTKADSKWTNFLNLASTDLFNHGITAEIEEEINKTLFD